MWQKKDNNLYKEFQFQDFKEAFEFIKRVSAEAEAQNHHPRWQNQWNKVQIWLSTHDPKPAITAKDEKLAKSIDEIYAKRELAPNVDEKTTKITEVKLFADGGSRGNPGPSASGFAVLTMTGEIIHKGGIYLGITTNNQAEYRAVKLGLEEAKKLGARVVHVYLDSLLVVNQMKGVFKVRNRDLWPVHQSIKEDIKGFKEVTFSHVPRELNKLADAMVNQTLDSEKQ